MQPNYIPTANPFGLARPPVWFLAALFAYDPQLRVFPSTCKAVYQVGRVARYGAVTARPNPKLPDTLVFAHYRIWPWKEVLPQNIGGSFGWQKVLDDLPEYDTQRFRDPAGTLDAHEAQLERELDLRIADEAEQRAIDMYRTLQLMDGQRVGAGVRAEGAGYRALPGKRRAARRRAYRPVGAGAGAMFTGR